MAKTASRPENDAATPPERRPSWTPLAVLAGLAVVIALIGYGGTFDAAFQFDDYKAIVKTQSDAGLGEVIAKFPRARWLTQLTFAIDVAWNRSWRGAEEQFAVGAFHRTNLLIHLGAALVLYGLALSLLATPGLAGRLAASLHWPAAAGGALLFLAHPLQTQSVTYVSQRAESLCGLLLFATLWAYTAARRRQHEAGARPLATGESDGGGSAPAWRRAGVLGRYALAAAFAALAMMTKEVAVAIPVLVLLLELCFFGRSRFLLVLAAPLLLGVLVIPIVRIIDTGSILGAHGENEAEWPYGRFQYAVSQLRVFLLYIRLMVLPYGQTIDHDLTPHRAFVEELDGGALALDILVTLGALLANVAIVAGGVVAFRRGARLLAFAVFGSYLVLAPSSSLLPLPDLAFEHRLYIPLGLLAIALVVALAARASGPSGGGKRKGGDRRNALGVAVILVVAVLTGVTRSRNAAWESTVTLWGDAVEKAPDKARPHVILADALFEQPKGSPVDRRDTLDRADALLRRALELDPDRVSTRRVLCRIEKERGLALLASDERAAARIPFERARALYLEILEREPESFVAHKELGDLYASQLARWKVSYLEEAIAHYQAAVAIRHSAPGVRLPLAETHRLVAEKASSEKARRRHWKAALSGYRTFLRRVERRGGQEGRAALARDRIREIEAKLAESAGDEGGGGAGR